MTTLIPNRFLFTFEFPLRHRAKFPSLDGSLSGWTDAELLPALGAMDNRPEFAPVWACWNETGICVACRVTDKRTPLRCDPANYWKGDNLRVCIDTRPSPENKRATRFCRQFFFLPTGAPTEPRTRSKERSSNRQTAVAGLGTFQRAREEPPPVSATLLRVASRVEPTVYAMEAMMPAECLTGFDPQEYPRLGFYYMLEDADRGQQYLTVGDDLLWFADPSTWAIAALSN